jgi:hypothetical protein
MRGTSPAMFLLRSGSLSPGKELSGPMLRCLVAVALLLGAAGIGTAQTGPGGAPEQPTVIIEEAPDAIPAPPPPDPLQLPPPPPAGPFGDAVAGRVPFHGNYCGRGNRGGEPTDALDAICKAHDECYDTVGDSACSCDRTIEGESLRLSNDQSQSPELRRRAASVAAAFQILTCRR